MKIGIPRALLYHKYGVMWETFLRELGADIVLSGETSKDMFDDGVKRCLDEVCLPVKIFYGHVLSLKDRADKIFIPQVISVEKRRSKFSFTCPKMIGLPDMIKATFPALDILEARIDRQKTPLFISYFRLGLELCKNPLKIIRAYQKAIRAQAEWEKRKDKSAAPASGPKIALLTHSYNLCGSYPNVSIEQALRKLGAVPFVMDLLPKKELLNEAAGLFPDLSWNFERELLGAAKHIVDKKLADGVIMLANFACGPDSLVGDYILRLFKRSQDTPFTLIIVDEHTGEAGLMTRIEAFVDMINFKKKRAGTAA